MEIDYPLYLAEFHCLQGARDPAIRECQRVLKQVLPDDYVRFLRLTNGGEGFIGQTYAVFFPAEELVEVNKDYQVEIYAPGLLIFGSNGAGEGYGFDTRESPWPVVVVPFIGMEWRYAVPMGSSFREFLQILYEAGLTF